MVAKISIGRSLYGALAYNTQKVNAGEGKFLASNKVFDNGDGRMGTARLLRDFCNSVCPKTSGHATRCSHLAQSASRRPFHGYGDGKHRAG